MHAVLPSPMEQPASACLSASVPNADPAAFLAGGGETGAVMRAFDWAATELGDPAGWPQSLKTAIRIMLSSRQPIWIGWGPQFRVLYNDAYLPIIGGRHPQAIGRPTHEVWHEIWDYVQTLLHRAVTRTEGTYEEQMLLIMERNGYPEETYYTFSYTPLPNDDGSVGGIICANSDETQRVIADRQLKALRELAAAMPQAADWREACALSARALAADPQDVVFGLVYAIEPDAREAELVGVCGAAPDDAVAPRRLPLDGAVWPCAEALRAGVPLLLDDLAARFGGALPPNVWQRPATRAALVPIAPSSEGEPACVLVVGLNPLRLYGADYQEFLELAATQIGASLRYARAYEQERRRAQALAEIDSAKTAFFSNISHEFRTPLTLMLAPLEDLLQSAGLAADQQAALELAQRNGLRLLKLVNTLLDFSRLEAGRVRVDPHPTDIAALTADLASLFRSTLERAGLTLDIDCPTPTRAVMLDRDMWEKIVLNLMSNAYKFTYEGGVHVSVRETPDGHAEVRIADTGVGIGADDLPRIFDRFHQVTGVAGRSIEGSGIGLALVQEFVQLQGGTVRVESEANRGTVFILRLPLGPSLETAQRQAALTSPALARAYLDGADTPQLTLPIETPQHPQSGRVLVVDDNDDMRAYIGRILAAAGYQVDSAADGRDALLRARARRPDLVLSDVMMPHLDGFGLLAALRADPGLSTVPVLLVSARAGEEASVEGLGAGADDYLTKPFSARELLARVSGNLRLNQLRQETARRLAEEARTLEILNHVGAVVAAELDMTQAVQAVVRAASDLTGAALALLTYPADPAGGPMAGPRVAVAGDTAPLTAGDLRRIAAWPTGVGVLRQDDLRSQGLTLPGLGHAPARSYLSAPVRGRDGVLLGHLYLVHPEPRVFDDRAERLTIGIVAQAALAIDNATLFQAAQREIAERGQAQAALRELNDSLERRVNDAVSDRERLWTYSEDLLLMADGDGRLQRLSPSWTRRLGHAEPALLHQSYCTLIHPDDVAAAQEMFARLRAGAGSQRGEHRLRTADAQWRWVAWTWSHDPASDCIHGVGRDITADKAQAAALQQAEEALRMSQKMEAVGQLTGGVAHDFNNLLQVISGNLQLMERDLADPDRARQRLQRALAGVDRGSRLAAQLLAFGRRQPLAPKTLHLGRFLRDFDEMLRRAVGEGVELATIVPGTLGHALVDPNQMENALLNLAINARDAMQGHGRLTLAAANTELDAQQLRHDPDVQPGRYVMLSVSDTGCGMDEQTRQRVFEPFFTTKPEGQGTGLGLSMVYGFVRQSGGHVSIESEPGRGTTVRLYLPCVAQPEPEVAAPPVEESPRGQETVLVVEDDDDVRATVVELLGGLGYRMLAARDAHAAFRLIEDGAEVDLLFTDVVMPGPMRSPELARLACARLPRLAVLFTSGYADDAIVHDGRLDEGVQLLSKPYTAATLAKRVRAVLDARPAARGARPAAT